MIGIDKEAEEAFTAAHDKAELDRAEREAEHNTPFDRGNWKAYRTKSELSGDLTKENINRI